MGTKTGISWTESTWNPFRGCSKVSKGCANCYAEVVAARFSGPGQPYEGLALFTERGPRWTGKVAFIEEHLLDPFRWKKPRKVFVNSMSDVWHESVVNEWIDRVFAVMAAAPHHIYQVLTKRPDRMRDYMARPELREEVERRAREIVQANGSKDQKAFLARNSLEPFIYTKVWPLPNVWLGVSVEDQETAEYRIPRLRNTLAAVRFLSCEPLLEAIDLSKLLAPVDVCCGAGTPCGNSPNDIGCTGPTVDQLIHWVIVGGESGTNARQCDVSWVRSLVKQCADVGTTIYVKQLGAKVSRREYYDNGNYKGVVHFYDFKDSAGSDISEWVDDLSDLCVRQYPNEQVVSR